MFSFLSIKTYNALSQYDSMVNQHLLIDNSRQRFILQDLNERTQSWWPPAMPFYYLWGSVGSGKTTIVNILFESHLSKKQRWHYSDFIHHVSNNILKDIKKPSDWTRYVKKHFKRRELLCIDEWIVEDITQVMMWRSLLPALWSRGVYVVVTSNLEVDDIYQNGLGREHFLKTIELIKHNGFIYDLIDTVDYRKKDKSNYKSPFINAGRSFLKDKVIHQLSKKPFVKGVAPILLKNDEVLVLDFMKAITPPIWRKHYIQWVAKFQYILIDGVSLNIENKNQLTNWVRLVDLLYDEGVFVFMTIDFTGEMLNDDDLNWPERTKSRILSWIEHQSRWSQQKNI